MDKGLYFEALPDLKKIIESENFLKLDLKDQLFIRKRTSWIDLSIGNFDEGWNNFAYNWLKNSHKFKKLQNKYKKIKYLISFNQVGDNEKILIWNDGGYGDFIYQLRLLKYFNKNINFKIFDNKMTYLLNTKNIISKASENFDWHLPINEIPRVLNFNPFKHKSFDYNYLIKPIKNYKEYNECIGVVYKTDTSADKSIDFRLLGALFEKQKKSKFLILQKNLDDIEKKFFKSHQNVKFLDNLDKEGLFSDTFNIVNSLKSIISIDTAVSHIAGYLSKKCFLLLSHPCSFYWMFTGSKCNDYLNHHLIRQKEKGDWKTVINNLINNCDL